MAPTPQARARRRTPCRSAWGSPPCKRTLPDPDPVAATNGSADLIRGARSALIEERVAPRGRRHERLLHRAEARPPPEVHEAARLVVGAGGARAAEGLLSDDSAGALVVDVEVAGRVAEYVERLLHHGA